MEKKTNEKKAIL